MYKPQKAKKVFLVAVVFSVVSVVLYFFVFWRILHENGRVAQLNGDIANLTSEKDSFVLLKKQVSETETARNKINSYFIPSDGTVPFLNKLQDMGKENNLEVKITSVSVSSDKNNPESIFENVSMTIDAVGSWSDVYRFTSLVELLPFGIYVNGVSLERTVESTLPGVTKKKVDKNVLLWRATIDIVVLKLK